MSRADIVSLEDRRPFYLYVDEFQNFATDSFAVILSEARKYGPNLTIANQYISQMNPIVKDSVFGNVGSMISFRVGADDAAALQRYYEPQFDAQDMIQLHNRHMLVSMSIDGEKTPAFSATTLTIPQTQADHSASIIEYSRHMYAKTREEVEQQIALDNYTAPKDKEHNTNTQQQAKSHHATQKPQASKSSKKSTDKKQGSKNKPKDDHKPKPAPKADSGMLHDDKTISLH